MSSKVIKGDTFIANSSAASFAELSNCSRVSTAKEVPEATAVDILEIKHYGRLFRKNDYQQFRYSKEVW